MGDAMDKYCLQNSLGVVEGVTHAGQAAKGAHAFTYSAELGVIYHPSSSICILKRRSPGVC